MFQLEATARRGRRGAREWTPFLVMLIASVMTIGCGSAMHPVVHAAIHETLNSQFRTAGIVHPEPLSEALEYFCLDDTERARVFVREAYQNNAPEQLMAVARVLRQIAPMLGSYGEKVVPFLTFLSGDEGSDSTAESAQTATARNEAERERAASRLSRSVAASREPARPTPPPAEGSGRCGTNLGFAGESCTGSPDCQAGLGCIALQCRARSVVVGSPVATNAAREAPAPALPVAVAEPRLPVLPSQREVRTVLEPLGALARRCAPGLRGSAPLALVVVSDGSVVEAHVRGPLESTRAATCIQDMVMNLRFPAFSQERLAITWAISLDAHEQRQGGR